jgi:hypothetical protein
MIKPTRPVTMRAVFQRLNRVLAKEDRIVKAPRGRVSAPAAEAGTYFIVDLRRDAVVASGVTAERLEKMARDKGVLAAWEEVER